MVLSFNDAFEVTWKDPADAQANWRMEKLHYPYPQPALAQDIFTAYVEDVYHVPVTYVNGYAFMRGAVPVPPTDEVRARGAVQIWRNDFLPAIKQSVANIRNRDYDSLTAEEVAMSLPGIFHEVARRMFDTVTVVQGFIQPAVDLTAFCERELGEDGATLAVSLLQGFGNETSRSMADLEELAAIAARQPAVAEAIKAGRFEPLKSLPEAAEFNERLQAFLDEFGWRAESWCLFHVPTWAEDPSTPLKLIGRYLTEPGRAPAALAQRAVSQREAAASEIEARIDASKLDEFRALRKAAEQHVEISEERTLWQLLLVGSGRVAVIALGRKLVALGVIDQPADAAFLSVDELVEVSRRPRPLQDLVAHRRRELAHWETLTPPDWIGSRAPAAPPNPETIAFFRYFAGAGQASVEGQVIKGVGVSKGSVKGRARVILELQDSDRLQPGEVLVCRTTSAPWTPLIAIAGGIVTDTGGLLSHSAIVAREYAIPAVTGTRVATTQIQDGVMLLVDGEKGTVTIEE